MLLRFFAVMICLTAFVFDSYAQAPTIEWQYCHGSDSTYEDPSVLRKTTDGGYVMIGSISEYSWLNSPWCYGEYDVWVVKTDSLGTLEWRKNYGGSKSDGGADIIQTKDGGYALVGYTLSNDLDVSGFHGGFLADVWVVKLDPQGDIQWQRCFGGTSWDAGSSIIELRNELYIGASSESNNGDVSGNHGSQDYWFLKLDTAGNLLSQKCLGGSGSEQLDQLILLRDSTFLAVGYSTSANNGDVIGGNGLSNDIWLVKLDTGFNIIWQNYVGGSGFEFFARAAEAFNGEIVISCITTSNDPPFQSNHGNYDIGIMRFDSTGVFMASGCLGGSNTEENYGLVVLQNGNFLATCVSNSDDGDVLCSDQASWATWLVEFDSDFNIEWSGCYGIGNGNSVGNMDGSIALFNYADTGLNILCSGSRLLKLRGALSLDFSMSDTTSCDSTLCIVDIDLNIFGGFTPYTVAWSNGETTEDLNDICSGVYQVTVTDAIGSSVSETIAVNIAQEPVSVAFAITNSTCGNANGDIDLFISGGAPPYEIIWGNSATTEDIANVPAGNYDVTVTDATGCSVSTGTVVETTPPVSLTLSATTACGTGAANGTITPQISGGTQPFELFSDTGAFVTFGLDSGWHTVSVVDSAGCSNTATVYVPYNEGPTACFTTDNSPCACSAPYTVLFKSCSTPLDLTHQWVFGGGIMQPPLDSTYQAVVYTTPGTYGVLLTVTDSMGCSDYIFESDAVYIDQSSVYIFGEDTVYAGSSEMFVGSTSPNYNWTVSPTIGVLTSGNNNQDFTVFFQQTGLYNVCVTSVFDNPCGSCPVQTCQLITVIDSPTVLSHERVLKSFTVDLFPNPALDKAVFTFTNPALFSTFLRITNLNGSTVELMEIPVLSNVFEVNTGAFHPGIYLFSIETPEKYIISRGKLVVQ